MLSVRSILHLLSFILLLPSLVFACAFVFLGRAIAQHSLFQRDGHDLYCRAPVPFVTAALGGTIEVPTAPGIGVAIREDRIESATLRKSAICNLKSAMGAGV